MPAVMASHAKTSTIRLNMDLGQNRRASRLFQLLISKNTQLKHMFDVLLSRLDSVPAPP
jgi:hypothetical protein